MRRQAFYDFLRLTLIKGEVLYVTNRNTQFTFVKWLDNGNLLFQIPSRTVGAKPNLKSIPKSVLIGEEGVYFYDCRLSVFNELNALVGL